MEPGESFTPPQDSQFQKHVGYELTVWREAYAEMELTLSTEHLNRSGMLHGGVITTVIDAAGGYAGCFCPHAGRVRKAVTLSMTSNFMASMKEGTLRVVSKVQGGGRKVFFTRSEVFDGAGNLIATGDGTYRYTRGSDDPRGIEDPARDKGT